MPDAMDAAQALALERLDALNERARLVPLPPGPPCCVDCDCDLAERRRALGAVLCVPCATLVEQASRHFAGGRR